jgi:hypothetical protein
LLEFAFGGDYFIQDIYNYKEDKHNVCCWEIWQVEKEISCEF